MRRPAQCSRQDVVRSRPAIGRTTPAQHRSVHLPNDHATSRAGQGVMPRCCWRLCPVGKVRSDPDNDRLPKCPRSRRIRYVATPATRSPSPPAGARFHRTGNQDRRSDGDRKGRRGSEAGSPPASALVPPHRRSDARSRPRSTGPRQVRVPRALPDARAGQKPACQGDRVAIDHHHPERSDNAPLPRQARCWQLQVCPEGRLEYAAVSMGRPTDEEAQRGDRFPELRR